MKRKNKMAVKANKWQSSRSSLRSRIRLPFPAAISSAKLLALLQPLYTDLGWRGILRVGWLATGSAGVDLEGWKKKGNGIPLCMTTCKPRMGCKSMDVRNHVCFL